MPRSRKPRLISLTRQREVSRLIGWPDTHVHKLSAYLPADLHDSLLSRANGPGLVVGIVRAGAITSPDGLTLHILEEMT